MWCTLATRLRFRTHQDALDFADHIVQKANWLSSIYNFGRVVQNYREGNLGICATIRVRGEAHSMLTGENLVSARDEQTKCVFGRASKPQSHWVYRAPEPETNEECGTEEMIVEVRGNRLCTVFPGSVYVSGEAIAFDDRHDNCQSTGNYSKCTRSHRSNRH
jgi:hypothetical protein